MHFFHSPIIIKKMKKDQSPKQSKIFQKWKLKKQNKYSVLFDRLYETSNRCDILYNYELFFASMFAPCSTKYCTTSNLPSSEAHITQQF